MKNIFKEFENIDVEDIMEFIENGDKTCFEYYIEDYFDMFYQEVIENEISLSEYSEQENKILSFIKCLEEEECNAGIAIPFTASIKDSYQARNNTLYFEEFQRLERERMLGKVTNFSKEDIKIATLIGTRGIGQTAFLNRKLDVIIWISDLHGIIILNSDDHLGDIIVMADKCGVGMEKINN